MKNMECLGRKEAHFPTGNHAVHARDDGLTKLVLEG